MKKQLLFIFGVILFLSTSRCAKRGTPTGGFKDSIPPQLVSANPPLKTVNFDKEKVVLNFDEYIQLKNIANQLIVSPPIEKSDYKILPEGTVSKKIEIRFNKPPRSNTTFNFNFGAAVEDYNEGNAYPFLSYTFSTGDYLDSLTLSGTVKHAYAMEPINRVSIHLYPIDSTYTDSTIYLQKPLYIGNTLDSVYFNLQSLAPGKYEMLAIRDYSFNYLFDQNIDQIGFFEEPITLPQDSIKFPVLFQEIPNFRWGSPKIINNHHLEFGFFGEVDENKILFDSVFSKEHPGFFTRDREKDTLHYWFEPKEELDSIMVGLKEKDSVRTWNLKPYKLIPDSLTLSITPANKQFIHFLDTIKIQTSLPVQEIDTDNILLFDIDTLEVPYEASIDKNKDIVYLTFEKVPNDRYQLQLFPNAITDFLGATNDTLMHSLRTKEIESYGTLLLKVEHNQPELSYFLELLDNNGKVVRKMIQNPTDRYTLPFLIPGDYQVRFVNDKNGNGKWDTGNYLEKRQPEEVIYLKEPLKLRANWELNEIIKVED